MAFTPERDIEIKDKENILCKNAMRKNLKKERLDYKRIVFTMR